MPDGINITGGFNLAAHKMLDLRGSVADSTERLAIKWVVKGIRTKQLDTGAIYEYIGDEITNVASDWVLTLRMFTGSGSPADTLGFDGDIYIDESTGDFYKKSSGTWGTPLFTLSGATFLKGATDPSDSNGNDGDIYIQSTDGSSFLKGDVFLKESGTWGSPFLNINPIAGVDGDKYATSSTSSLDLDGATDPINPTVGMNLAWTPGMLVRFSSNANPSVDYLEGTVTAYNPSTGAMTVASITRNGTGIHTDWSVNLTGTVGLQGKQFTIIDGDVTLTQTFINNVQVSGLYNPRNLYVATVQNDTRTTSQKAATPGLIGDMGGYLIIYDGGSSEGGVGWVSTRWRGSDGLSPTFIIGTVTTLSAGASATVTISGTHPNYILNFGIPRGDKGDPGDDAENLFTTQVKLWFGTSGVNKIPSPASSNPTIDRGKLYFFDSSNTGFGATKIWDASPAYSVEGLDEAIIQGKAVGYGAQNGVNQLVKLSLFASLGGSFSTAITDGKIQLGEVWFSLQPFSNKEFEIWAGWKATQLGFWYFRIEASLVSASGYAGTAAKFSLSSHRQYMVISTKRE
jgi:hypothetical protein